MTYLLKSRAGFGADDIFTELSKPDDPWGEPSTYNIVDAALSIADNIKTALTAIPASEVPASEGNLNLSADGTTSISMADFDPKTCKPRNWVARNYVMNLQNQLNRVAHVKGFTKIGPDGQVGTGTLGLFKKVQAAFAPGTIMGNAASCLYVSADADVIGDQVKSAADTLKAPAMVPAPSGKAATIVTAAGTTVLPPPGPGGGTGASVFDAFKGLSTEQGIVLAGVAGGIGYLLLRKKGKSKGRR